METTKYTNHTKATRHGHWFSWNKKSPDGRDGRKLERKLSGRRRGSAGQRTAEREQRGATERGQRQVGHVMRQGFSFVNVHGGKIFDFTFGWQTQIGRDGALRCPRRRAQASGDGTRGIRTAKPLASRGSCPAEDGEAPDSGRRSAPSLPAKEKPRPGEARAGLVKTKRDQALRRRNRSSEAPPRADQRQRAGLGKSRLKPGSSIFISA